MLPPEETTLGRERIDWHGFSRLGGGVDADADALALGAGTGGTDSSRGSARIDGLSVVARGLHAAGRTLSATRQVTFVRDMFDDSHIAKRAGLRNTTRTPLFIRRERDHRRFAASVTIHPSRWRSAHELAKLTACSLVALSSSCCSS
jgi:hypothetical protein